jgi:hypothetical protein
MKNANIKRLTVLLSRYIKVLFAHLFESSLLWQFDNREQ